MDNLARLESENLDHKPARTPHKVSLLGAEEKRYFGCHELRSADADVRVRERCRR